MVKIQIRGGTAAQWTSVNPILAQREMGLEIDTNKFKFGNGVGAWTALPYAVAGAGADTFSGEDGVIVDATDPENIIIKLGGEVLNYTQITSKLVSDPDIQALLIIDDGHIILQAFNDTTDVGISINIGEEEIKILDETPVPKGFQYAGDYSATFVDRSLVDKGYVDTVFGEDFNIDGGTATSVFNELPVIDGGGVDV